MHYNIGAKDNPILLKTPPLTSEYTMHVENKNGTDVLVCTVGKTVLLYNIDCIKDLHHMLKEHADWMELGSADEQKPAREGTVEAWARSDSNPAGGWYGLKKDFADVLACTFRLLWKYLDLQSLHTNREEIKCGQSNRAEIIFYH